MSFDEIDDLSLIALYRKNKDPEIISEILRRYQYFILKVISRWNSCNSNFVKLTPDDFQDTHQNAKLAVIHMMNAVSLDKVKNLSVTIKSYIYNSLNAYYRHRKYERMGENLDRITYHSHVRVERARTFYLMDTRLYLKYHYGYTYYKLGLMSSGSKKKRRIISYIQNVHKKLKDKLRNKIPRHVGSPRRIKDTSCL